MQDGGVVDHFLCLLQMHGMRAALVLALLSYAVGTVQAAPATLRFVSYNIQSGSGVQARDNLSSLVSLTGCDAQVWTMCTTCLAPRRPSTRWLP